MKKVITLLIILTSCLFFVDAQTKQAKNQKLNLALEGRGVAGVVVGQFTMSDIIRKFGKKYKLITHSKYSYQMKYEKIGLSFYACQSDKQKKIFSIEMRPPFRVKTSRGIILGKSKVKDVLRIYGAPEDENSSWFEYKGVDFRSIDSETNEANLLGGNENLIINEINIYPRVFELCKETNK